MDMPDKNPDWVMLFMYSIAAISGALGGCAAAAITGMRTGTLRIAFFAAYAMIGLVCGLLTFAVSEWFGISAEDTRAHVGWAVFVGGLVPLVLAAHNFGARFAFKMLGGELQVTFRKDEKAERRDDSIMP